MSARPTFEKTEKQTYRYFSAEQVSALCEQIVRCAQTAPNFDSDIWSSVPQVSHAGRDYIVSHPEGKAVTLSPR
jgi:hypothetical protein